MSGTGIGMIRPGAGRHTILDQAVVHIKADEKGAGAADVTSAPQRSRGATAVRFDRACVARGRVTEPTARSR
jgi:hypothetical protein